MKEKLIRWITSLIAKFWGHKLPIEAQIVVDQLDQELDKLKAKQALSKLREKAAIEPAKQAVKKLEEKSRRIAAQANRR